MAEETGNGSSCFSLEAKVGLTIKNYLTKLTYNFLVISCSNLAN